jgi:hypothetical protein
MQDPPKFTQIGLFCLKINHLATLFPPTSFAVEECFCQVDDCLVALLGTQNWTSLKFHQVISNFILLIVDFNLEARDDIFKLMIVIPKTG